MTKRILLINSDIAKNRGDRAIAEGNIQLIKSQFPDAKITALSQFPERDSKWYDVDILDTNFQSLSPIQLVKLLRAARKSDLVFWGGGEILKDYTNKAALWYWVGKMTLVWLVNHDLYGAFQGIGPTNSSFSRRLIVSIVNRCKVFFVRDDESRAKLMKWGADSARVVSASDPAVIPMPTKISSKLAEKLSSIYAIDETFLSNFICIGPRDWFHYKKSGVLPFKYRRKLAAFFGKSQLDNPRHEAYMHQLRLAVETISRDSKKPILFVPMHMEESDTALCEQLKSVVEGAKVLSADELSPSELRSVIARAQAMVGFRLHSNIIGISAGVPSVNIYYVDKGRVFFDQIGQQKFCVPIERALEPSFPTDISVLVKKLLKNRKSVKADIETATEKLRRDTEQAFEKGVTL